MKSRFNKSHGSSVSFFAFQDIITATTGFLLLITVFLALNITEVVSLSTEPTAGGLMTEKLQKVMAEIVDLKGMVAGNAPKIQEDEATLKRMIEELKRSITRLSPTNNLAPLPAEESMMDREVRIEQQKLLTKLEALQKELAEATDGATEAGTKIAAMERELRDLQSRLQQAYDRQNTLRLIPERSGTSKEPVLVIIQGKAFRIQAFDGSAPVEAGSLAELTKVLGRFPAAGHFVVLYFKPSGAQMFNDATAHVRSLGYEIGYDLLPEGITLELGGPEAKRP